jgi:hypothetical protein
VFENEVLRRIFGPKRDGLTGGWRKLHNEELHTLCSSPNIIRMIQVKEDEWAGHAERMWRRGSIKDIGGKKRPLGRRRRRCVDDIKMDLREIGWGVTDWIDLAQDRDQLRTLVNTVMNFRVALKL